MRVQVGPLPSGGVGIWIAYARTVVAQMITHPELGDVVLDPDLRSLLDRAGVVLVGYRELRDAQRAG